MTNLHLLLQIILHIDTYLLYFVTNYGFLTYVVLFAVIFCETGLVVIPFLPGDSLLFAAGTIAAHHNSLNIQLLFVLLIVASITGNKLNYLIGRGVGPAIFNARSTWFFNKTHLERAHVFYQKHGGKTLILARFIPIIRTFAPFVAGVANMKISQFTFYNILSALLWIGSLLSVGYFFGNLPFVKENFTVAVYSVILLSLTPPFLAYFYKKVILTRA